METWLRTIVVNTARNSVRRRRGVILLHLEQHRQQESEFVPFEVPDNRSNPEQSYECRELESRIATSIERLGNHYAAVIRMCVLGDCSYLEALSALDVSLMTVKARIFRGREMLRRSLSRDSRGETAAFIGPRSVEVVIMSASMNELNPSSGGGTEAEHVAELTFQTIVFATDFSSRSENAGRYAVLLAEHFSATLVVAHAFLLSQPAMEVEAMTRNNSQQRKNIRLMLACTVELLAPKSVKTIAALMDGDPQDEVARLARSYDPSLVVLGTHGGGSVERGIIGSVAETILRTTQSPTLTVGPHVPRCADSKLTFRRILCATDLTPAAASGIALALQFARRWNCDLDVLHVVPKSAAHHPDRLAELTKELYGPLDRLFPERSTLHCNARSFVTTGHAHEAIAEHIRERSIDLLVIGIRKTSHLGLEMRTSGAFRIIVESPCPVITVAGG